MDTDKLMEFKSDFLERSINPPGKVPACVQDFQLQKIIGKGGFSTVYLGLHRKNLTYYAIKVVPKKKMNDKEKVHYAFSEKLLLQSSVSFPFIIDLHMTFQDNNNVYFVLEYMQAGDLHTHMSNIVFPHKHFTEVETKFYMAQIFMALQYLHSLGFIYRDLKRKNILIGWDGYWKLCDFGLLKVNAKTECGDLGTPKCMAPETIKLQPHTVAMDWWAFGVLLYEIIAGVNPFRGKMTKMSLNELYKKIISGVYEIPNCFSAHLRDLITNLLQVVPEQRFGEEQVRNHPWFMSTAWQDILEKKLEPPIVPSALLGPCIRKHLWKYDKYTLKIDDVNPFGHAFDQF